MNNIQISAQNMYGWHVWWQAVQVSYMCVSRTSKERQLLSYLNVFVLGLELA